MKYIFDLKLLWPLYIKKQPKDINQTFGFKPPTLLIYKANSHTHQTLALLYAARMITIVFRSVNAWTQTHKFVIQ